MLNGVRLFCKGDFHHMMVFRHGFLVAHIALGETLLSSMTTVFDMYMIISVEYVWSCIYSKCIICNHTKYSLEFLVTVTILYISLEVLAMGMYHVIVQLYSLVTAHFHCTLQISGLPHSNIISSWYGIHPHIEMLCIQFFL